MTRPCRRSTAEPRARAQARTRRRRAWALIPLLALGLAGCGGAAKPSDPQQVTRTLRSYLRAQSAGDGQTACALLTSAAQRQLVAFVVTQAHGLASSSMSCTDAVTLVHAVAGERILTALRTAEVGHVHVHGAAATAVVSGGSVFAPQRVSLKHSGGAWRIDGVPGLGG